MLAAKKTATNKKLNKTFFSRFVLFKNNISKKIINIRNNNTCPERSVPCSAIL